VLADHRGYREHVTEVGRSILIGGGPDGDEDNLGSRNRGGDVCGKGKASVGLIALDERLESRFIDGQNVPLQPIDLLFVNVGANDIISRFGQTSADDETDVTRSYDRDSHIESVKC
jgi:lysophospholipase L1-like esterase